MLIKIDIDEEELKTKILGGISVDEVINSAIQSVKGTLKYTIEQTIKKTKEYRDVYSSDDKRIKDTIKRIANDAIADTIKTEIKAYVVLESQLPKIVKSHVNDFIREYVEDELNKQIRQIYSVKIGVQKNEIKEGKSSTKNKKVEEVTS